MNTNKKLCFTLIELLVVIAMVNFPFSPETPLVAKMASSSRALAMGPAAS